MTDRLADCIVAAFLALACLAGVYYSPWQGQAAVATTLTSLTGGTR